MFERCRTEVAELICQKKEDEASESKSEVLIQMTHMGFLSHIKCLRFLGIDGCQSWSFSTWTDVCPLERELAFSSKINERLSRMLHRYCTFVGNCHVSKRYNG